MPKRDRKAKFGQRTAIGPRPTRNASSCGLTCDGESPFGADGFSPDSGRLNRHEAEAARPTGDASSVPGRVVSPSPVAARHTDHRKNELRRAARRHSVSREYLLSPALISHGSTIYPPAPGLTVMDVVDVRPTRPVMLPRWPTASKAATRSGARGNPGALEPLGRRVCVGEGGPTTDQSVALPNAAKQRTARSKQQPCTGEATPCTVAALYTVRYGS